MDFPGVGVTNKVTLYMPATEVTSDHIRQLIDTVGENVKVRVTTSGGNDQRDTAMVRMEADIPPRPPRPHTTHRGSRDDIMNVDR